MRGQIKPINPQTGRPTPTQILKSKPPTPLSVPPPSKPPPPPPKSPQHSPSVQSSPQQQQIENHYAVSHLIQQQQHQQQYEQKPEITSTPTSTPKRNGAEIIRFNSYLSSQQQQQQNQTPSQKHCVTGSFDPDDFDSFDEDDEAARASYHQRMQSNPATNGGNSNKQMFHIPLESIEKIRQSAFQPQQQQQVDLESQSLPQPQLQQTNGHMQLVQFDPNDFDSFDEDEQESSSNQLKASSRHSPPVQLPSINIDLSTYEFTFNQFYTPLNENLFKLIIKLKRNTRFKFKLLSFIKINNLSFKS